MVISVNDGGRRPCFAAGARLLYPSAAMNGNLRRLVVPAVILGVLLIAACFGYLADSLTPLLLPSYEDVVGRIANIALTLGEPAIILWLLIRGTTDQPLEAVA